MPDTRVHFTEGLMTAQPETRPVAPYLAIGLSTVIHGIANRAHIHYNLETIEESVHAAIAMTNVNMPVKLLTLAEGALTGFTDEIFDLPHALAARELFIDVPGPETDRLGRLAKLHGVHIIAQCKARWPEVIEDRFFNTMFIIAPTGEVVHRAAKNHLWCRERSCVPHDIYDRWVECFGDGIGAFYPVYRNPELGNVGTICCSDGEYPEAVRALAFSGAEVVYRPSEAVPMTNCGYPGGGTWMIQNRAHAEFNSVYMLCPNSGPVFVTPKSRHPVDITGGNSHIVGYRGEVLAYSATNTNSIVAAIIDIEALRQFRMMNLNSNWLKDLRTELFKNMYENPIHPKNLWMKREPACHAEVDEIYRDNIRLLIERGTWTKPAVEHEGCRFQSSTKNLGQEDWSSVKKLWSEWDSNNPS
jgi:predicted amidohydrolase